MKKFFYSVLAIAVSALAMVSCSKTDKVELQESTDGHRYSFAVVDDVASTKAILGTTGVAWEAGDRVGMFLTGYTGYAEINMETTPKSVILYSTNVIPAGSIAYAYYPYAASNSEKTNAKITLNKVQTGVSSSMPLAGIPFTVEEEAEAKSRPNGTIKFLNLASIIEFNVFSTNAAYQSETVQSITVKTNDGSILSGDGYLDLTQVSEANASSLVLNFSDADNRFDEVKVNQEVAVADSKDNATPVYMAIRPGTFSGTITVITDAASYTWNFTNKVFNRNGLKHYNMNLNNAERTAGAVETVVSLPYSESFTGGIGEFETDGVEVASTSVWTQSSTYGMKASARVDGTNYEAESWLISPWIDLTGGVNYAAVAFDHVHRYAGTANNELTFWILTDEEGASWTQLSIPTYASGTNWDFVNSGEISLNDYVGKKVKVAFKYTSSTAHSATWEIKNFSVHETAAPITPDPEITYDATTKSITITCSEATAHIGYTIDGSDPGIDDEGNPTGTTTEYTGPFTISETCTVKAFAAADHMDTSSIVEKECVVSDETVYEYTWNLATDSYASASETQMSWTSDNVKMVANKANSQTATNNYCPPTRTSTRFYTNSTLTFSPQNNATIVKIEYTATSENYATALANSTWTNATASANNTLVTIIPTDGANSFSATIGGTTGATSVKVYYTVGPQITWNLTGIEVTTQPTKTTYTAGESFDPSGMVVTATYADASNASNTKTEEITNYTYSPEGALTTGNTSITVSYEGKTANVSITVTEASTEKKTYTLTISTSDFNTTSYAANNNEKISTATATDNSQINVKWTSYQVMLNGSEMQWQKSSGYIYNSTDLGTIKSVTVNSTSGSFTTTYGTSEKPTGTIVGGGYFQVKVGSATGKTTSIVVVFEK